MSGEGVSTRPALLALAGAAAALAMALALGIGAWFWLSARRQAREEREAAAREADLAATLSGQVAGLELEDRRAILDARGRMEEDDVKALAYVLVLRGRLRAALDAARRLHDAAAWEASATVREVEEALADLDEGRLSARERLAASDAAGFGQAARAMVCRAVRAGALLERTLAHPEAWEDAVAEDERRPWLYATEDLRVAGLDTQGVPLVGPRPDARPLWPAGTSLSKPAGALDVLPGVPPADPRGE
ncbi:MAG: hypothetical protein HY722_05685 [Planctomycetes bacterium]|nr:hypothetical protein [Planctomycetota bacterium]